MEGGVWGLVIIFSAFMIQFLAFGATATIGVYNIELLEYFPGSTVGVSLIASLNYGIFLGSGPIVSFLMTKYSFRSIALFGSALVVLGLLGMPLLPYIPTMCICFGLMTGFGSCCAYIPSHVLSGMYYDKNRSLATGVATSGSGLGGAVMPVVAGLLIETYSWKGSFIVVAGLCMHLFVFSALLRMPKHTVTKEESVMANVPSEENAASSSELENKSPKVVKPLNGNKDGKEGESKPLMSETVTSEDSNTKPTSTVNGDNKARKDGSTAMKYPRPGENSVRSGLLPPETGSLTGLNGRCETFSLEDLSLRTRSHTAIVASGAERGNGHYHHRLGHLGLGKHHHLHNRGLSHSLSSLHTVGTTRGSYFLVLDDVDNPSSDLQSHTSLNEIRANEKPAFEPQERGAVSTAKQKGPKSSRHIYIFMHYGFNIYFLSNIMWNASCSMVSSFAPEYLRSQGLSSMEAAYLLGAFGFGCFVGGIFGGILGNVSWINRQVLYTVANIFMGVILTAFPHMGHRHLYLICLLLSGLAFGIILGLLIIVLTDLIGIESLSNGLGYLMLSNGIGTFIGPPLAGILKEATGGFESGIILSGVLAICGGLIMLLMPCKSCLGKLWSSCCCCCTCRRQVQGDTVVAEGAELASC